MKTHKKKINCYQVFNIPKKLSILGQVYRVRFVSQIYSDDIPCAGTIQHFKKTITLSRMRDGKERKGEDILNSFFHECSHAIDWIGKIGKYPCHSEVYASISGTAWADIFRQLELSSSISFKQHKLKSKSKRRIKK